MSRGFCKVCSSPYAKEVNKRLAASQPATQISEWLKGKQFPVTRQTLYTHKEHITDPKATFVEEAKRNPVIRVSNDDFLQAVIDAAATKVAANPDDVTIEQGLKAVGVREARREKNTNILMVIAQLSTNRQPVEVIEGEYAILGETPVEELATSE